MSPEPPFRRVFRLPGQRGRVRRDLDEELAFHVEMREKDLMQEGWDRADARAEAIRQFGNVEDVRRECRRIGFRREGEMRIADSWDRLRHDLRFARRQLVKTPLVTLLAVLTLGIGIASATVVYTVIDAVVLDAVPLEDADRLMAINETTPAGASFSTSELNFLDWRARQTSFTDLGAYTLGDRTLTGVGDAERLSGLRVHHTTLSLLGLDPLRGRHFRPDEDEPGGETRVVLLAEGFWDRRFGSDPAQIGRTLILDGEPYDVVGVVPTDRAFPGVDVFTPLVPNSNSDRGNHMLQAIGRLTGAATLESARDEMTRIAASLAEEYPVNSGWGAEVTSLYDSRVSETTRATGTFLLGAVALLLLMACGSVSNMLVARATTRRREIGLRALAELPDVFRDAVAWPRFTMQVLTAFGLIALLLAAMGIYGITAFNVARRIPEIGIRLALGAQPQRVLANILREGMKLATAGIVAGVAAALALAGLVEALLYQIDPRDPLTYAIVPFVMAAVAAMAAWIPARRATRVDPREALDGE
jgi:putative ABC transport system permease protein